MKAAPVISHLPSSREGALERLVAEPGCLVVIQHAESGRSVLPLGGAVPVRRMIALLDEESHFGSVKDAPAHLAPWLKPLAVAPAAPHRTIRVDVPGWIRGLEATEFETMIGRHNFRAHLQQGGGVVFAFAANAFLPAGVGLWLLSFLNQLSAVEPGQVHLEFGSAEGLFGYLDRSGFLQLLAPRITTTPERPVLSGADLFRGQAGSLVEIAPLWPGTAGEQKLDIVARLVSALVSYFPPEQERTKRLRSHVYTLLGELVDNVFSHSETVLPGYVSLQAYRRRTGPSIQVSVTDSGIGIPESIRRSLGAKVTRSSDAELILQAFRDGLSRLGAHSGRGCGLKKCAMLAAVYGSTVSVRTPRSHIVLHPPSAPGADHHASMHPIEGEFAGTHLVLEFNAAWVQGPSAC